MNVIWKIIIILILLALALPASGSGLIVNSGETRTINGETYFDSVTINSGGTLIVTETGQVNSDAEGGPGTLNNAGIIINSGFIGWWWMSDNSGTINNSGSFITFGWVSGSTGTINNYGNFDWDEGLINSGIINNYGDMTTVNMYASNSGTINNYGNFNQDSPQFYNSGTIKNFGKFYLNVWTALNENSGTIFNFGELHLNPYEENGLINNGIFWNKCTGTLIGSFVPPYFTGNPVINPVNKGSGCVENSIPEFPTIALPFLAAIGLVFVMRRNK